MLIQAHISVQFFGTAPFNLHLGYSVALVFCLVFFPNLKYTFCEKSLWSQQNLLRNRLFSCMRKHHRIVCYILSTPFKMFRQIIFTKPDRHQINSLNLSSVLFYRIVFKCNIEWQANTNIYYIHFKYQIILCELKPKSRF